MVNHDDSNHVETKIWYVTDHISRHSVSIFCYNRLLLSGHFQHNPCSGHNCQLSNWSLFHKHWPDKVDYQVQCEPRRGLHPGHPQVWKVSTPALFLPGLSILEPNEKTLIFWWYFFGAIILIKMTVIDVQTQSNGKIEWTKPEVAPKSEISKPRD